MAYYLETFENSVNLRRKIYIIYIILYRLQINIDNTFTFTFTRRVQYDLIINIYGNYYIMSVPDVLHYCLYTIKRNNRRGNTMIVMSTTYLYNIIIHHNEAEKRRNEYVYNNIMFSIIIIVIIILYFVIGRTLLCLILLWHMDIIYNLFKRVWRWIWCRQNTSHTCCTFAQRANTSLARAWYIYIIIFIFK